MSSHPIILHVDADAFFASVEQALNPDLKGLPVIVGSSDRGVVSAASYEARKYGIHSAMPVARARRLCPNGIFLDPNFEAYKSFSKQMFSILYKYSPIVEATSIDEGYIDLQGTLRLHKAAPWEIAHAILSEIRSQVGINVSGGVAKTRTWAKMATSLAKPNGLLYLDPVNAQTILNLLPVGSIPGIGKKTREILQKAQIFTVGDFVSAPDRVIRLSLGEWGAKLVRNAMGQICREIILERGDDQKSYSKDRTLEHDSCDYYQLRLLTRELGEKLALKLRLDGKGARTITFKVRYNDFFEVNRSMSFKVPVNDNKQILSSLDKLFGETITRRVPIRQVGVKLSNIDIPVVQMDLFDPGRLLRRKVDMVSDAIRCKFGFNSILVSGQNRPHLLTKKL